MLKRKLPTFVATYVLDRGAGEWCYREVLHDLKVIPSAMTDDEHSHMCMSPCCGRYCTPKVVGKEQGVRMYHKCADPCRSGKQVKGPQHRMGL